MCVRDDSFLSIFEVEGTLWILEDGFSITVGMSFESEKSEKLVALLMPFEKVERDEVREEAGVKVETGDE